MTCQSCRRWRRTRGLQDCFRLEQECLTRSSAARRAPTGSLSWPTSPPVLRAPCWRAPHIRGLYQDGLTWIIKVWWVHTWGYTFKEKLTAPVRIWHTSSPRGAFHKAGRAGSPVALHNLSWNVFRIQFFCVAVFEVKYLHHYNQDIAKNKPS